MVTKRSAAVIVAHPSSETIWSGGTVLMHPGWDWTVLSLCRGRDRISRERFFRAVSRLNARGVIEDFDDCQELPPLAQRWLKEAIGCHLTGRRFDLVFTHSPNTRYTRNKRDAEIGRAVLSLWQDQAIGSSEMRLFAYSNGGTNYYPDADETAHLKVGLPQRIWQEKLNIIRDVYAFSSNSWEARTAPRQEAFWCFHGPREVSSVIPESTWTPDQPPDADPEQTVHK